MGLVLRATDKKSESTETRINTVFFFYMPMTFVDNNNNIGDHKPTMVYY